MSADHIIEEDEMDPIKKLQKRMEGYMSEELFNDAYLFRRFLRARDFNLDNAEIMLRNHLEWRRKKDIENALKFKKPEVMEKYISYNFFAIDKEGCLVRYCHVGHLDFKGILNSCSAEEASNALLYEMEIETLKLKEQSKKLGRNVDKCTYIYNVQDFSFAQATDKRVIQFLIQLLKDQMNNYPERLKASYIYNLPVFFAFFLSMFKPFVPNTTMNKVKFYGDDSYKKDLIKVIDADQLPMFLGGNLTDPDGNPLCHTLIPPVNDPVPKSYYIRNTKQSLSRLPGVKKVTLARGSYHEVCLQVEEPESHVEWEFETKCRDIGFGLFYQEKVDGEEKITELVPIRRIDANKNAETGFFKCEKPGTYVILFDNTYSLLRAKEVFLRTKIVTPKEHETEVESKLLSIFE